MLLFHLSIVIFFVYSIVPIISRATEEERVKDWYARGNVWPPNWQEETLEMKEVLRKRELEILSFAGSDERWENYLQFTQNRLIPKFTANGFEVIKTPEYIHQRLLEAIQGPLEDFESIRNEGPVAVIYHPEGNLAKFIDLGNLATWTMNELKELHEQWAGGIKLIPTSAYGVRLYQNGSSLTTHYDKVRTHVISSIVHIAHEYDNDDEPWPIQIEDHNGKLYSVNLEPGEMLFYESAKALHGRLTTLKGKYYGSIFIHYMPEDTSIWNYTHDDVIANVPPHWSEGLMEDHGERYAGACITVDSRVSEGAPIRTRSVENPFIPPGLEQSYLHEEL